jgi:hypothetical protein
MNHPGEMRNLHRKSIDVHAGRQTVPKYHINMTPYY